MKLTQLDQDKLKAYWDSHRNKQSEKLVDLVLNKLEIPEELKSETESQHEHQNLESEDERKPETLETNETNKDQEFELGTNNNTTDYFWEWYNQKKDTWFKPNNEVDNYSHLSDGNNTETESVISYQTEQDQSNFWNWDINQTIEETFDTKGKSKESDNTHQIIKPKRMTNPEENSSSSNSTIIKEKDFKCSKNDVYAHLSTDLNDDVVYRIEKLTTDVTRFALRGIVFVRNPNKADEWYAPSNRNLEYEMLMEGTTLLIPLGDLMQETPKLPKDNKKEEEEIKELEEQIKEFKDTPVDKLTPEQKNVYWEYQRKQTGILKNKLKLLETQGTYNADILGRHLQKKSWTNMLGDILTRETNWNEPDQQETLMIFDEDEDDEDEEDDTELEEKDKKLIQILKLVTQKGPQEHYFVQYPTFDGNGDPYTWLEEYETACAINGIENGRKLDYLDAALKGDAKLWWRNVKRSIKCFGPKKRTGPEPKDSFKFHFIAEYCGLDRQWKWTDELRDLKQEQGMPVKKYAHRLKDLYKKADPLNRYPEHDKINQFLKGLRRDIGILVQTQNPMSLNQAIESAKNIERAFAQNGSFALASGDMNQELREIKAMIAQQNQVSKPFLKCNLCYKQGDHTTENCPRRTFKPKPEQQN